MPLYFSCKNIFLKKNINMLKNINIKISYFSRKKNERGYIYKYEIFLSILIIYLKI